MSSFTGTSVAAAGTPKDTGFSGSNGVAGSMDIQVTQSQTSAPEAHDVLATELAPADSRATVASGGGSAPVAVVAPADSARGRIVSRENSGIVYSGDYGYNDGDEDDEDAINKMMGHGWCPIHQMYCHDGLW